MLNCVIPYLLLLVVAGSVFSLTVPYPQEKPLGWEQPVVITEEFFPSQPPPQHHSSHSPPNSEFKEIIGIELQRIPFHGSPEREILEHERRREQEILEHRKHEILEPAHEPHLPEILKHERREHAVLSHQLPPSELLNHGSGEFDYHPHGFQDVLDHEQRELEHREHELREEERREHEIMMHERAQEHDILEHEHEEHDISAHEYPYDPHYPPWEDPDFVLSEEEHHEHDHEFHHEELFPEVSRRRINRRREGASGKGGSRRSNSNSNRRESSNRRGNSNRQTNNNRRENSNREDSRRREGGSNINTEELFPRRNRQNNNRRNSNRNNRRNNNNGNREGSRRSSNIDELAALEEDILLNVDEVSSHDITRPERDVDGSYFNENRREPSTYESLSSKQSESMYQTLESSSSRPPSNNFETKKLSDQQGFVPGDSILSNHERRFNTENSRRSSGRDEEPFDGLKQQIPGFSNSNKEYSNSNFKSTSNLNEYSNSNSNGRRPDRPSSNIFKTAEHSTLDGINLQRPISRPTGSSYNGNNNNNNNNELQQGWNQQGVLTGSSHPSYSDTFGSSRPEEFSSGESSKPSFLGSRPGSGKPIGIGSLSGQDSTRPNRPNSSLGSLYLSQEGMSNRPGGQPSGQHSYQEYNPNQSSNGSLELHSNQERPGQLSSGSSEFHSKEKERPGRPSSGLFGHYAQFGESLSGTSSGLFSNQENSRPSSPNNSHFSNQEHSSHKQSSRPHKPSSRPDEENSRPRPSNGNNLNNESDLISVQEDSWLWPNQSQDEDKQNRRVLYSGGNKKQSTVTKRPNTSGNSDKKQHSNLKLLPTDSCGVDLGNKIIGGENTQLDEFPWMVLLQHSSVEGRTLGFGCGGSLISPRYVLTAAHCIKGQAIGNNVRVTKVRLGEFDTSSDTDCQGELCSPSPVDVAVEEIIVHPKYRATDRAQLNDIALIRLKENVKNSAYISPICLPIYGNKDHVGEKMIVAGWGKTSNGQNGASSKTKQKVSVPVVTLEECSPFYNRINIQLNNTQMCAGGEQGKDSCQGDSGGPLMGSEIIDSQVRWQVHGIVSFGPEDCGIDNVAGVYTKVSEYIDWILDNMKR